ncbi:hypothetical protein GKZ89_10395 [Bacillus mangrovi]|uniref:Uncharacterized protein n=1 Tax=Metabacillus mangrovi TaxID=1491830 RepID=A0A7X2S5U9_9BACI|nr:DUF6526 family protein [Metabacillus mangrovi]MTH53813.1 hypothetical protein [Metabacillus mangrovi]
MEKQNYSNHTRIHPLFHFGLTAGVLAVLVTSIIYAATGGELVTALFMILVSVCLILFFIFIRTYPLKAQDRAIRAEENLRYYALTGKLLDSSLTMNQIVALRFAPDAEFPGLAEKAAAEKLAPKEIKQSIQNWKADHNRI